jgi:ABC-2 type transport system ATP-binding protein
MDDRIDILSGGWKRRVNIAAAILHRPALLILDEPTVGVDIDARNGLHEVIAELSRTGIGVLLATHDLDQAEALCTTVGFLQKGIMAPQGPPRTLLKNEFGSQKELVLELRQLASPRQAEALSKAGFQAIKGGFSWFRYTPAGVQSLDELHEALNQAGIHARETRVREPGLDSLFVKLSLSAEARQ